METVEIREKLHQYIDLADERKIEAIFIMLEDEIGSYCYGKEEIELFHARRDRHLKGETVDRTVVPHLEGVAQLMCVRHGYKL